MIRLKKSIHFLTNSCQLTPLWPTFKRWGLSFFTFGYHHHHHHHHDHHHHVPGLLQTSAITAFHSTLSSVLLISSLLWGGGGGGSFPLTKLFRLCVCTLCAVFLCLCYHKSFHPIFAFLIWL